MEFEVTPFDLPGDYAEGVVSLDAFKDHIGVLHADQDGMIAFCRDAAVDMVERYCSVYLAERTGVVCRLEALPPCLDLGFWPVSQVTALTWLDSEGNAQSGDPADWRIVRRGEIALKPGRSLPPDVAAGVEVTFSAGFSNANRPAILVRAVKMFAAHLFRNREAVGSGAMVAEVPLGFRHMCSQYRMPVI